MRKLLFFITTTVFLLSCSNNDNILNTPLINDTKYKITLNVEVPIVEIETSTMKSNENVAEGDPLFYNMVIYKENGDVYYSFYYDAVHVWGSEKSGYPNLYSNIFTTDGTKYSAQLNLAPGSYHIAMMIHRKDAKHPNTETYFIDPLKNYDSDSFNSSLADLKSFHNGGVYFNTADLTVVASAKDQSLTMELKPMWSYIDVNIEDAQTFEVPKGTNALQFIVSPRYYGFYVKNKLAPFKDDRPIIVPLDSIRSASSFNLRNTVSKSILDNNNISTTIKYLKIDNDTTVLQTKELPISNSSLENGYYYNIHGKLGNSNTNSSQTMNISLGSFAKDEVNINF